MFNSIVKRFLKGFVAGGIASALMIVKSTSVLSTWHDMQMFAFALIVGFITGGLLAVEKALSWEDIPPLA